MRGEKGERRGREGGERGENEKGKRVEVYLCVCACGRYILFSFRFCSLFLEGSFLSGSKRGARVERERGLRYVYVCVYVRDITCLNSNLCSLFWKSFSCGGVGRGGREGEKAERERGLRKEEDR